MRSLHLFVAATVWWAGVGAAAAAPSGPIYQLRWSVARDGKPVVVPELIVGEGQAASVELGPDEDGDTFLLKVTASQVEHPRQRPGRWLRLEVEVMEQKGGHWTVRASPWAMIEAADDLAGGAPAPSSMTMASGDAKLDIAVAATVASASTVAEFQSRCAAAAADSSKEPTSAQAGAAPILPSERDPTRCCVTCQSGWQRCCTNSCCGVGSCGCCSPNMLDDARHVDPAR